MFFDKKQPVAIFTDQGTDDFYVEVDATIREEHRIEVEATSHPVEQGASITDHIRKKPREITINGIISNTPLHDLTSTDRFETGRAEAAWRNLQFLQDQLTDPEAKFSASSLLTVATTLETYESMALISLTCPRDAQRGNVVEFTATFREIFTVKSETIDVPETPRPPKTNAGNSATTKAKPAQRQSFLNKNLGGGGH